MLRIGRAAASTRGWLQPKPYVFIRKISGGPHNPTSIFTTASRYESRTGINYSRGPLSNPSHVTPLRPRSPLNYQTVRCANAWGIRAVIGALVVGFMFFARRWAPRQRWAMEKRLKDPQDLDVLLIKRMEPIARKDEETMLVHYLDSVPSGPLVIVGPEGSGKSTLLRRVLSKRKVTLFLDPRQSTVISGDELLVSFILNSGYLLPSSDPISSLIMKQDKKQGQVNNQELVVALDVMMDVLRRQRDQGWPHGVPVLCIDDIHTLGSSKDLDPSSARISDDPNFLRLMDWCITVSDRKLANVVFVTTYSFAHLDLDRHTSFRGRRSLFSVKYPSSDVVKDYLLRVVNPGLPECCRLTPEAASQIIACLGGQMRDIGLVVGSLMRGGGHIAPLRAMVGESYQTIEEMLEDMIDQSVLPENGQGKVKEKKKKDKDGGDKDKKKKDGDKDKGKDDKKDGYDRFLRFWSLMEQLVANKGEIERRVLIANVFPDHPRELEQYLAANIVQYMNKEQSTLRDKLAAIAHDLPDEIVGLDGAPVLLPGNHAATPPEKTPPPPSPSAAAKNPLLSPKASTIGSKAPADAPCEDVPCIHTSFGQMEGKEQAPAPVVLDDISGLVTGARREHVMVIPGSPRLMLAFQQILKDPRMLAMKGDVEKFFNKQKKKDDMKDIEEDWDDAHEQWEAANERLSEFVSHLDQWRTMLGETAFEERRVALIKEEASRRVKVRALEDQHTAQG